MTDKITFKLDGREVEAEPGETIWQVAQRHGTKIPHLCWHPAPGYRADGNCRACMVEVEGERVLAASCQRKAAAGMKVKTATERAKKSREMVFELLMADQPERDDEPRSRHRSSGTGSMPWASRRPAASRAIDRPTRRRHAFGHRRQPRRLHQLRPVRARLPRGAGQRRDRHGLPRPRRQGRCSTSIEGMGQSTCVACGECVQVCPTGALMEKSLLDEAGKRVNYETKSVDTLCPYCGVGCQTTVHVKDNKILYVDGRDGPANNNRLCVKGRFGFDYIHHPDRLTKPLIRRDGVAEGRQHADPARGDRQVLPRGDAGRRRWTRPPPA